jgi:SAM-dependent methyltransferase
VEHDSTAGFWDEKYRDACVWGVEPNRALVAHCAGLTPRRVLDIGCGQGRNAVWLALEGHEVTAVDQSPVAIEQTEHLAARVGTHVEAAQADVATVAFAPEFDIVVLAYVQAPAETRKAIHRVAADALAPGGEVFLVAHHLDNLDQGVGGPPMAEVLFTETDLADDFAGLVVERNERVLRRVDKDGRSGDAIDVVLTARKPVTPQG